MRVFILAGGLGTRIFPFSTVVPKPLLPVAGVPCVRWIVETLLEQGFTDIYLCINKSSESNFKHEFRDLKVKFSVTEGPMGTAGELLHAKKYIKGDFLLVYGDDLTEINYAEMVEFHKKYKAKATLAVTTGFTLPVGVVTFNWIDNNVYGEVESFREKPCLTQFVWTGSAILPKQIVKYLENYQDIAYFVIPKLIEEGGVHAYIIDKPWWDVGNIENWRAVNEYFRQKNKKRGIKK
ncbi:MAG: hypothetical protein DRP11_04590 [Candidatus Aenigmatarchaeota archaeon]|nr:MAG: hypothetical protein DRP11_04590 [Candidatus Aenigmarchaeota archaeon]